MSQSERFLLSQSSQSSTFRGDVASANRSEVNSAVSVNNELAVHNNSDKKLVAALCLTGSLGALVLNHLVKRVLGFLSKEAADVGYVWFLFILAALFFTVSKHKRMRILAAFNIPAAQLFSVGCIMLYVRRTGQYIAWSYAWLLIVAGTVWASQQVVNAFGIRGGVTDRILTGVTTGIILLFSLIALCFGHTLPAMLSPAPVVLTWVRNLLAATQHQQSLRAKAH